jgi:hypothetical protein
MTNRTPFRPLNEISARLLASDQLKWQKPESDQVIIFTTNGKHFGYEHDVGATSGWHAVRQELVFRPIGLSWAAAEELVKLPTPASTPPSRLPKNGDRITVAGAVAVTKEGCRQALDELLPSYDALCRPPTARQTAKVGDYAGLNYSPRRTVIAALPPGRRKYVKLFLKSLGFYNLDRIPTTIDQEPYSLGRNFLSAENREKLISLAPNIVLRDVL